MIETYQGNNWYLVPLQPNSKQPVSNAWQHQQNCIAPSASIPNGSQFGLAHAYSNTCAIDVDQLIKAAEWLLTKGIRLPDLMAKDLQITSGVLDHGKLIYKMPDGLTLPTKAYSVINGEGKRRHAIQFRCATADGYTVQDVLPPSVHPETGQPYQWVNSEAGLQEIPPELLNVWQELVAADEVVRPAGEIRASVVEIESALTKLDPDMVYEEWLRIGMAIHHYDPAAFEVFDTWSAKGIKYTGHDGINGTLTKWNSFTSNSTNPVTVLSIFKQAWSSGWRGEGCTRTIEQMFEIVPVGATPVTPITNGYTAAQLAPPVNNAAAALESADFDGLNWLDSLMPTDEEAEAYADPEWIVPNMVIAGHIIVVVGWYNSGKTTIFMDLAKPMSGMGYTVKYINDDLGQGDAKYEIKLAKAGKFILSLPSHKGVSMEHVLRGLYRMADEGKDLSKTVFIIDTLKKLIDVMGKGSTSAVFKLFRRLQGLGATIILLGHANKFLDADNRIIVEGVGDIKNDADDTILLYHHKDPDSRRQVVSTVPDKVRGIFKGLTYTIHFDHVAKTRSVVLEDTFDPTIIDNFRKVTQQTELVDKNGDAVVAIKAAIKAGNHARKEIVDFAIEMNESRSKADIVLKGDAYLNVEWYDEAKHDVRGNACHYVLGFKPRTYHVAEGERVPTGAPGHENVPSGDTEFDENLPSWMV